MRITYWDDCGMFNADQEPFVVVGAAITNVDNQYRPLADSLDALVEKYIPPGDREGFTFHATELWSGGKYFAERSRWPKEKRWDILEDLSKVPGQLEIPLTFGYVRRDDFPLIKSMDLHDRERVLHNHAFLDMCGSVDRFMQEVFPDETTILVGEDNGEVRKSAKEILKIWTDTGSYRNRAIALTPGLCDELPLRTIVDTTHFALKSEGRGLQLADLCAFLIKKHLTDEEAWRFYRHLKHSLIQFPKMP